MLADSQVSRWSARQQERCSAVQIETRLFTRGVDQGDLNAYKSTQSLDDNEQLIESAVLLTD